MTRELFEFTAYNNTILPAMIWLPEDEPIALIQITHGMTEHIGRYADFVNLASKEYNVCISRYLPETVRFITCVFGEEQEGRVIEKGIMCKMARGEMVRYMAENQIENPEQIKSFDRLNYRFDADQSNDNLFVFILNTTGG